MVVKGDWSIHRLAALRAGRRRGIALVWVVLMFLVLLALTGLALDTARVLMAAHELQNASDAAALAGAALVKTNATAARQQAVDVAGANSAEKLSVNVSLNGSNDPSGDVVIGFFNMATHQLSTTVPFKPNALKVVGHRIDNESLPLIFGRMFGVSASNISRFGIAKLGGETGDAVIVLDPTSRGALTLGGSVRFDVNGGPVQVNSTDSSAVTSSTSSASVDAIEIDVVGGGKAPNFTGTMTTGVDPIPDPYANLPAPDDGPTQPDVKMGNGDVQTIDPGYYANGITMTGGNLTLNPGIYVLDGKNTSGGLQVTGGTITGKNCMIYIKGGSLKLAGGDTVVNLTPPTSGTYAGISLWQAASNTNDATISGSDNSVITGIVYIPTAQLTVTGNATGYGFNQLVVWELKGQGSGQIVVDYNSQEPGASPRVFLVK